MYNWLKIFALVIISLVTAYFGYFIYCSAKYSYKIDMNNYKPYFWIFKDSAKIDVDTNIFVGCIRKTDLFYHYIYKQNYYIGIWEFKNLNNVDLGKINFYQKTKLDNVNFFTSEILNKNNSPEITVKFGSFFNHGINLNLDEFSTIIREFKTLNYKGFYGRINKMSLSRENGEHLVIFDCKNEIESYLILFYKRHNRFYVISVNSDLAFDENILKILNLE